MGVDGLPGPAGSRELQQPIAGQRLRALARNVEVEADARRSAREFEAMFAAQMLKPVFDTLPQDGLFSGGTGHEIYQGLMVQEYGKAIAAGGGLGLADALTQEILRLQDVAKEGGR